jgi:ribose-phosphate pyrophosphokinase
MKNKEVILVDDIVHTATKITRATKFAKDSGANGIYAFVTHNLLNRKSFQAIELLPINELVTTNSVANVIFFNIGLF